MNKILIAISVFIWGFASLLNYFGVLDFSIENLTSIIMIAYGLSSTNLAFRQNNRRQLIISSTIFLLGILFIVKSNYEITETRSMVFVSIFLITASISILLYIENLSQKVFLYSGMILFIVGILLLKFMRELQITFLIYKTVNLFEIFWPIILIVFGLSILVSKNK